MRLVAVLIAEPTHIKPTWLIELRAEGSTCVGGPTAVLQKNILVSSNVVVGARKRVTALGSTSVCIGRVTRVIVQPQSATPRPRRCNCFHRVSCRAARNSMETVTSSWPWSCTLWLNNHPCDSSNADAGAPECSNTLPCTHHNVGTH